MVKMLRSAFVILIILSVAKPSDASDEQEMFLEAKKLCIEQEWIEAIDLFEQFLEKYPDSNRSDDAKFWIAYSLEKIPGKQSEAFFTFSELVKQKPESPWVDDAIVHQINLSEQFIREGENQYRQYLYDKLDLPQTEISSRAAISLGKLGDQKAIPVLEKLTGDQDYGAMAANLVAILKTKPVETTSDTTSEDIRMVYDKDLEHLTQPKTQEGAPERDSFLWFNTQRYEQYRSMLRNDNNWSRNELEQFAMWHILDSDEFEELHALSNEYDRKEWMRKYWKSLDPTPTTEKNELFEEFEHRVNYARQEFSEPWNARNFRYLPDEHIRSGWYCAPWDARGELYIKYGEPDVRSVQGFHTEEWVYYKYGVDFIVKQYMTNIYGNAINAGSITRGLHSNQNFPYAYNYNFVYPFLNRDQQEYLDWNTYNTYLDANFVYKNEIRYEHQYDADPLSDFEIEILSGDSLLSLKYQIPVSEFKLQKNGDTYHLTYLERYSILDEDMREVALGESTKKIDDIADDDSMLVQEIDVELPPGTYRISIQIKDINSKKLGIYTQVYTAK